MEFFKILSEAIGRLTPEDVITSIVLGISICLIILSTIFIIGTCNGVY